jgi:acyl dehydratase
VPIPPSAIGTVSLPLTVCVDRGRLRLFAKATGETDRAHWDLDAAIAAGHPDLPVPLTYLFGLELEADDPFGWLLELGVDLGQVLHGAQSFQQIAPTYAGDVLTVQSEISDVHVKRGGLLELIERRTTVTRDGNLVATLDQTVVVRNAAAA